MSILGPWAILAAGLTSPVIDERFHANADQDELHICQLTDIPVTTFLVFATEQEVGFYSVSLVPHMAVIA